MNTLRITPLAAGLLTVLSCVAPAGPCFAATRMVTSCDDGTSPGTLRYAIGGASDMDVVDLSQMPCSTITLLSGEIEFNVSNLTIVGSSTTTKTVSGNKSSRIFDNNTPHPGKLEIDYLVLRDGQYQGPVAEGGCVVSSGDIVMLGSTVTGCSAIQTPDAIYSNYARGGGIFTRKSLTLMKSTVSGNTVSAVNAPNSGGAEGGGIFVGGGPGTAATKFKYSTVENNVALAAPGSIHPSRGGGVFVDDASIYLYGSTLNGNYANSGGGLSVHAFKATISNSTISGNTAKDGSGGGAGGVECNGETDVNNSTIAFNRGSGGGLSAGGLLKMQSSIFADNTSVFNSTAQDIVVFNGAASVSGADNLVMSIGVVGVAPGVITQTGEPRLAPLANHGGPTATHALLADSPAVAHGNNTANLDTDQRGPGYPRPATSPDMGSYQRQPNDDEVYYGGFDR